MTTSDAKTGLGVVGAGAAACAACCVGPILGFVAASGIALVLGAVVFGAAGLLVALAVAAVLRRRRSERAGRRSPTAGPVPGDTPLLRASNTAAEPSPGTPSPDRPGHRSLRRKNTAASPHTIATQSAVHAR